LSKTTPRCFTEGGRGSYSLCLSKQGCLLSRIKTSGECLGEVACEQLFSFHGPPEEEIILDKTIAFFDGQHAFLVRKGRKITLLRQESFMFSSYVSLGDEIGVGQVIASKLSRKGTLRRIRSNIGGTILLVTADPLGKTSRYIILVDTEGVHEKLDCRNEQRA